MLSITSRVLNQPALAFTFIELARTLSGADPILDQKIKILPFRFYSAVGSTDVKDSRGRQTLPADRDPAYAGEVVELCSST